MISADKRPLDAPPTPVPTGCSPRCAQSHVTLDVRARSGGRGGRGEAAAKVLPKYQSCCVLNRQTNRKILFAGLAQLVKDSDGSNGIEHSVISGVQYDGLSSGLLSVVPFPRIVYGPCPNIFQVGLTDAPTISSGDINFNMRSAASQCMHEI